ncbi:hypothetical protein [Roseomonas elaeocarpi]|uniref:Uncharacterized protein n=1 Tax=Roseomonas elaeocarpi TaxID=907779 RepID=A0ABV6JS26_9PROT
MAQRSTLPLLAAILLPLLAGGCTVRQGGPDVAGWGDPISAGALDALDDFGHTGRLTGQTDRALFAALRVEQLAEASESDPLWQTGRISTLQPQLLMARRQMREALGIDPKLRPRVVETALYRALQAGPNRGAAATALNIPGFNGGGEAVLARADNLPRLPLVDQAAARTALLASNPGTGSNGGSLF